MRIENGQAGRYPSIHKHKADHYYPQSKQPVTFRDILSLPAVEQLTKDWKGLYNFLTNT